MLGRAIEARRGLTLAGRDSAHTVEDKMKLSIEAELVYDFAIDTQIIANLEASRASSPPSSPPPPPPSPPSPPPPPLPLSPPFPPTKSFCQSRSTFSPRHRLFPTPPLWRSADTRFALGEVHQVPSGSREQPSAIASSVRMSARVVRPARRGTPVSAAQSLLPLRQVHAVRAA